jgi:hypothetical protein
MEFFGPKGSLSISRRGFVVTPDRKMAAGDTVPQFADAHPVGGPVRVNASPTGEYWTQPLTDETGNQRQQFRDHVRNFLDCIKSRKQPLADVESGHRVATVCHLANISLRVGRKIRWDAGTEEIIGDPEAAKMLVRPYRAPWDAELRSLGAG